jgi:hypothetical protein
MALQYNSHTFLAHLTAVVEWIESFSKSLVTFRTEVTLSHQYLSSHVYVIFHDRTGDKSIALLKFDYTLFSLATPHFHLAQPIFSKC